MLYAPTKDHKIERSEGKLKMHNMHYHNSYELYYLEAGSREYFVEDRLFSITAGQFVLIAPGKLHRTDGEYGVRTLVNFTEEFLERTFSRGAVKELLKCFSNTVICPTEEQRDRLAGMLKELFACGDDTSFALALGALLRELSACDSLQPSGGTVSAMTAYINQNFDRIHHISQISDHFYISKFYLCRVFKSAMKMTVIDYLNRVRIKNACQYLRMTDKDIGQICHLCGFHDPAYFSNVFRKIMGMTPSQYRKGVKTPEPVA